MVSLDLPWWNLNAIFFLDRFLTARTVARAFEYGSGSSTIWMARRVQEVISVEHDEKWHPIVKDKIAGFSNVKLRLIPPDLKPHPDTDRYASQKPGWHTHTFRDYVHSIDQEDGPFDLIVIDGRCRKTCLSHALGFLKPDGLIVFDNSRRPRYRTGIQESSFQAHEFSGLTACLPYPDQTTILSRLPFDSIA